MKPSEYCAKREPIAKFADTAFTGVEIYAVDYGIDDRIVCKAIYGAVTYHRVKLRYGVKKTTFRIYGRTYDLSEFLRCGI